MGALPRDSEIPLLIVIMVVAFNLQTSETGTFNKFNDY